MELQDHIDENYKFFKKIGYDEEQSHKKAEFAMGDGDIVGEQFDLQLSSAKSKRYKYAILDLFMVLCVALYFFIVNDGYYLFDIEQIPGMLCFSEFWCFVFTAFVFLVCLICLIIATNRKRLFGLIFTSLCSIYPAVVFGNFIGRAVYWTRKGKTFAETFYNANFESVKEGKLATAVLLLLLAAVFFNGIIVYIKTKRLENTRLDIIKNKTIVIILSVTIILSTAFALNVAYQTVSMEEYAYYESTERSKETCEAFIKNIDSFMTSDAKELAKAFENTFEEGTYRAYDLFKYDDNDAFFGSVRGYYNDITLKTEISIEEYFTNPFMFTLNDSGKEYFYNLTDKDIFRDMTLSDAPLPAKIEFEYSRDMCKIQFIYDESYYAIPNSFILFTYNFDKNCFEVTDSSEFNYNRSFSLSAKQHKKLNEAVRDYAMDNICNIYSQIYDVSYCKDCKADNVYKIDMGYCAFKTMSDHGKTKISERKLTEAVSIIAKLDNGSIEIISLIDYSLEENRIKDLFSEKAYDAYASRNTKWYNDLLSDKNSDSIAWGRNE
ncbi:MAG: hypothetical protein K2I73_01735 [Eubacterium sp.]|nr:hypothetical protein [Eubacterium sp.]